MNGGYYDNEGNWQQMKHCFRPCGAACDCQPPGGRDYDPQYDARLDEVRLADALEEARK